MLKIDWSFWSGETRLDNLINMTHSPHFSTEQIIGYDICIVFLIILLLRFLC